MLNIDMWYGHPISDVDRIDCFFYPNEVVYRGNLYSGSRMIGDYTSTDSVELTHYFRKIGIEMKWEP